ncbi:hemerythrin family protein [Thiolapillus sp.]
MSEQRKQNKTQKVAVVFAFIFYIAAVLSVSAVAYFYNQLGGDHPAVAAWAAAIVFFIGGGVVLHVMGKADIPDFRIK